MLSDAESLSNMRNPELPTPGTVILIAQMEWLNQLLVIHCAKAVSDALLQHLPNFASQFDAASRQPAHACHVLVSSF